MCHLIHSFIYFHCKHLVCQIKLPPLAHMAHFGQLCLIEIHSFLRKTVILVAISTGGIFHGLYVSKIIPYCRIT